MSNQEQQQVQEAVDAALKDNVKSLSNNSFKNIMILISSIIDTDLAQSDKYNMEHTENYLTKYIFYKFADDFVIKQGGFDNFIQQVKEYLKEKNIDESILNEVSENAYNELKEKGEIDKLSFEDIVQKIMMFVVVLSVQ